MSFKAYISILLILLSSANYAQQNTRLKGIVSNAKNTIEQVTVTNTATQQNSITNRLGKFSISAEEKDTIVFTHIDHQTKKIVVTKSNLYENETLIILKPNATILDELVLTTKTNLALELGILQKPAKEYTKSERLLKAAKSLDASVLTGTGGGVSLSIYPIINAITGRTKMLKKYVKKERFNLVLDRIKENYDYYLQEKLFIKDDTERHAFISYLCGIEDIEDYIFSTNDDANLFYIKQIYNEHFLPKYNITE